MTSIINRRHFLNKLFCSTGSVALLLQSPSSLATTFESLFKSRRQIFYLQPIGATLKDADVNLVKTALINFFGLSVAVLPSIQLPQQAFYAPRNRYRADTLLDVLAQRLPVDGTRILGLTHVDISVTKGDIYDWGILGLARLPGTVGVISSFRCKMKVHNPNQASVRFAKVAVHEIGHSFGLPHCLTPHCIMHDAEAKVATLDDAHDFCILCRKQLKSHGFPIIENPNIPWASS